LRLRVLGANPRAAEHAGLRPVRLTVIAFAISGALIGMSGSVEILGVQGSFRADFNPAYGLLVIPLVFLARLHAIGSLVLVIAFSVIQIGGESAARQADITSDVLFLITGLILLFMAVMEYLRTRRGLGMRFVPPELADRLRPGSAAEQPAAAESRPAIGAGEVGSR
jgi:general nucleoside transport system permease protein